MNTLQNLINLLKKIGLTNRVVGETFVANQNPFKLKNTPMVGSVSLYYAGLRLGNSSFGLVENEITLDKTFFPINPDDIILVDYEWQ